METAYKKVISILGSPVFFWCVVGLFVLQALWIATSFVYPMIYDESVHFGVIQVFSHQFSPIIWHQPHSYDIYGNLTFGDASLYHYLMSFPYRLIQMLTSSFMLQVILLRLINILLTVTGLVIFSRLFKEIGIRQIFINISFLIFVLLPIVPLLAATINYDNMLFPLTAWFLWVCVKVLKDPGVDAVNYMTIVTVGSLASLVKYSFLPIFAMSVVYLAIALYRRHGRKIGYLLLNSVKRLSAWSLGVTLILLIIFAGLFSFRYIQSVARYGSLRPDCVQVMSKDRCLNSMERANIISRQTAQERPVVNVRDYSLIWLKDMSDYTYISGANTRGGKAEFAPPLTALMLPAFFMSIIAIAMLIYAWRSLEKEKTWYFLATAVGALTVLVYLTDIHFYYVYHSIRAIQPRYLLSVLPLVMVAVLLSYNLILRKQRALKLLSLLLVMAVLSQGGGAITHILLSKDSWYWQNSIIIKMNHGAKKVLSPFVRGA